MPLTRRPSGNDPLVARGPRPSMGWPSRRPRAGAPWRPRTPPEGRRDARSRAHHPTGTRPVRGRSVAVAFTTTRSSPRSRRHHPRRRFPESSPLAPPSADSRDHRARLVTQFRSLALDQPTPLLDETPQTASGVLGTRLLRNSVIDPTKIVKCGGTRVCIYHCYNLRILPVSARPTRDESSTAGYHHERIVCS